MTSAERLAICEKCGLVKFDKTLGPICDSSKWMNKETGEVSRIPHLGWVHGCACKLRWKVKNANSRCVAGKW